MKVSGVPHTLVYRSTKYDVPDYDLDPVTAAEQYWELEKAIWPRNSTPFDLVRDNERVGQEPVGGWRSSRCDGRAGPA